MASSSSLNRSPKVSGKILRTGRGNRTVRQTRDSVETPFCSIVKNVNLNVKYKNKQEINNETSLSPFVQRLNVAPFQL